MNPYGLLAIVIVAVLMWLGISALFLLRGVLRLQRHLEASKQNPLFTAAARTPDDLARLNQAAAQFSVQIETLRAAADRLKAAVDQLRNLSVEVQIRPVTQAFDGLIDVLR